MVRSGICKPLIPLKWFHWLLLSEKLNCLSVSILALFGLYKTSSILRVESILPKSTQAPLEMPYKEFGVHSRFVLHVENFFCKIGPIFFLHQLFTVFFGPDFLVFHFNFYYFMFVYDLRRKNCDITKFGRRVRSSDQRNLAMSRVEKIFPVCP